MSNAVAHTDLKSTMRFHARIPAGEYKRSMKQAVAMEDNRPQSAVQMKLVTGMYDKHSGAMPVQKKSSVHHQPVVQRIVQSKVEPLMNGGTLVSYYSTFDTEKLFKTEEEAWAYDEKFEKDRKEGFSTEARYPTPYSYHQVAARNVVGSGAGKWGPHTVAHGWLSVNLEAQLKKGRSAQELFEEQVLPPDNIKAILETEYSKAMDKNQIQRYMSDYLILYNRIVNLLKGKLGKTDNSYVFELMMRLMQMNPYTTYGKNTLKKAATKNKGEKNDVAFEESIDKRGKWNDQDGYKKYLETRQKLEGKKDKGESGSDSEGKMMELEEEEEGK